MSLSIVFLFQALRIILQFLQTSAARYGRYIRPLISVSVDFYVRLFVVVQTGKNECKSTASKLSMVTFVKQKKKKKLDEHKNICIFPRYISVWAVII